MNQTTSKFRAMLKGLALLPVLFILVFFVCAKATAQQKQPVETITDTVKAKKLYKSPYITLRDKHGKTAFYRTVKDLTPEEKKKIKFPAPGSFYKPDKISPNAKQLNSWATKSIYGVWLDGKRVKNEALSNYSNTDFVYYTSSPLTKQAINYGKEYFQIELYTAAGYDKTFVTWKDRKAAYVTITDTNDKTK